MSTLGGEGDSILESKPRIRHIDAISIVNLTLNPIRDQLSSLLHHPVPPSPNPKSIRTFASDDVDLHLRTRRRANSSASFSGHNGSRAMGLAWHESERDKAELSAQMGNLEINGESGALENGTRSRNGAGMARRRSLKGYGVEENNEGIAEELEPPSPPINSTESFNSPMLDSPTSMDVDSKSFHFPSTAFLPAIRRRSTSRASINSTTTSHSGSTIRVQRATIPSAAPSFVEAVIEPGGGRSSYTSELLQSKQKKSRIKALQRRLVDSFITLSIPPIVPPIEVKVEERPFSRVKLSRSSSSSGSLRGRKSSTSSVNSSPVASTSALPLLPSEPFYVSDLKLASTNPTFDIDSTGFVVDQRLQQSVAGEGRVVVSIWTKGIEKGKGKEKMGDAKLLVEYDVDLDALVALGKDPTTFPSLPPNSIVFKLGDRGHFTAPPNLGDSSEENSEEDGNQSDPGVHSSTDLRRPSRSEAIVLKEKEKESKRKIGPEKVKRDNTIVVKWCGIESMEELLSATEQIERNKSSIEDIYHQTNEFLQDSNYFGILEREISEIKDRTEDFAAVFEDLKVEVEDVELELQSRRTELTARRKRLAAAREIVKDGYTQLSGVEHGIFEDTKIVGKIHHAGELRRQTLVTTLSSLFPIEPAASSTALLFSIVDLDLPNSIFDFNITPEESISGALGYVAQVVQLLAAYMGVPLAYNIKIMGSRSVILDLISSMTGPRAFPLYSRGVEKYRFDYGVFLLNKDIEQLMYSQKLIVLDLRNTLPNLKSLLLSLSFDPSHSSFPSSTLLAPSKASSPIITRTSPFSEYINSTPLFSSPTGSIASLTRRAGSIRSASIRSNSPTPTITPVSAVLINGKNSMNGNQGLEKLSSGLNGRLSKKSTTTEIV